MKTTAFAREHYLSQGFDRPFIQQEGTFWRRSLWEEAGGALDLKYSLAAECELWHRFFRFSQLHSVDLPLGLFRVQREQRSQVLQAKYFREAWQISREEVELLHGGLYGQMLPAPDILTQEMVLSAAQERAAAWESQRL